MHRVFAAVVLVVACTAPCRPARSEDPVRAGIAERTRAWLTRLPAAQRGQVLEAFDARERRNWHYVPRTRSGLALRSMGAAARREGLALFSSVLGPRQWAKAEAVFRLEAVLRRQAAAANPNVPSSWRDPLLYFVSVFGSPREDGAWGLRLEGHHLSINLTFHGSSLRAATPLFFGASPASVRLRDGAVLRPLGREEELALRLVASLDAGRRRRALAGGRVPGDVAFGPARAPAVTGGGLSASALLPAQQSLLRDLLGEHRLGLEVSDSELSAARILWMGGMRPGGDLYYRIEAPTFVVEHRNLGSHVHSLWRDPRGDFGGR